MNLLKIDKHHKSTIYNKFQKMEPILIHNITYKNAEQKPVDFSYTWCMNRWNETG